MTEAIAGAPSFPCESLPQEGRAARLLGLYEQRQEGLFMQRIKIPGGRLSLAQWKTMAKLARRHTPDASLHLTTRQDIEFHDLAPDQIPALQRGLDEAGLTTVGACGDTLRNITLCPSCGLRTGSFDLAPLAGAVRRRLESLPGIYSLPRKFKVSLSGCADSCARPWINDLGIIADENGTFQAVLGGSLGPRPGTGMLCYENLPAEEIPALAAASVRLFEAEGDRINRSRARLRHVRERLGDEEFRRRLDALFQEEKSRPADPQSALERNNRPDAPASRLHVPGGELAPDTVFELLEILEPISGHMRIGFEHDLFVFGIEPDRLPASLRALEGGPRILACPGAHSCKHGLTRTRDLAAALRDALPGQSDLMIGISGCPNNCCHSAVADIGLIGRIRKINGEPRGHYRLLIGGGNGKTPALAVEAHPCVFEERIPEILRDWLCAWQEASPDRAVSFGEFAARDPGYVASRL